MGINLGTVKHTDYPGIVVIILGLTLFAAALTLFIVKENRISNITNQMNRNQAQISLKKANQQTTKVDPEKLEIINKIERQIHYPWESLFTSLEATHTRHISLLSIQPNMDKNEVLISAEAENIHEMLAFVRTLNATQGFDHVELLYQEAIAEAQQTNQQERVSFTVMIKLS
ncbi:MAG: hypothetical protein HOO90_10870 [Methylotenera sp.]|uniref:hypothetical protein n=1 Tax=Methylotenera sp. TaxID=2051956 RepID=UPI0017DDAE91|nr:hypothetical protein [Methylotenera sp.]NOU26021.1 hypothetical protein [Methylotenera sp.]